MQTSHKCKISEAFKHELNTRVFDYNGYGGVPAVKIIKYTVKLSHISILYI